MRENIALVPAPTTTTNVLGYFNPHSWSVYIEISEARLRWELKSGVYIRDANGKQVNDPIFENYVHLKGLSRATGDAQVPFNLLPKFVQGPRPAHPVTQATGFVRGQDGVTVPSYAESPVVPAVEVPMNRNPVIGMTVAMARKMGFAGRPRIVPEDYGASETTGAPVTKDLPDIKYSLESPPKINMSAPLTPELMEADRRLSPQQVAQRSSIQQNLTRASATASEEFDPAKVRPATRMMAPSVPTQIATVVVPAAPVHSKILPKEPIQRILPKTAVEPVQPEALEGMPEPMLDAIPEALEQPELASAPETPDQPELAEQIEHLEQPGVVANEADTGPDDSGKRFRCVMDGKRFKYRSQLKSYVERKYPSMVDELLKSYPAEG